jgi:hypothetical protein
VRSSICATLSHAGANQQRQSQVRVWTSRAWEKLDLNTACLNFGKQFLHWFNIAFQLAEFSSLVMRFASRSHSYHHLTPRSKYSLQGGTDTVPCV